MVSVTGAVPVSSDADAVAPAPDTDNYVADGNLFPTCPDTKTTRTCCAINTHPHCVGTKFYNDLGDQCSSCYCE